MKKLSILLILLLITGCSVQKVDKVEDEDKFAIEYSLKTSHHFNYSKIHDIFDILDGETGIVYFANSDEEKSIIYTQVINDIFNDLKVDKINYYNPSNIKNNNTKYYRELLNFLGDKVEKDDNENPSLDVPSLYFVKKGSIIGYMSSNKYSVDSLIKNKTKKKLKKEINKYLKEYKSA